MHSPVRAAFSSPIPHPPRAAAPPAPSGRSELQQIFERLAQPAAPVRRA